MDEPDSSNAERKEVSLNPNFNTEISGLGWNDEEEARDFGNKLLSTVRSFSTLLDLSRLERLVVASDYKEALKKIETGFNDTGTVAPTSNVYGEGGGMAIHVKRNNEIWHVVALNTWMVRGLFDADPVASAQALCMLGHELAHVHILRKFDEAYPGGALNAAGRDEIENTLLRVRVTEGGGTKSLKCFRVRAFAASRGHVRRYTVVSADEGTSRDRPSTVVRFSNSAIEASLERKIWSTAPFCSGVSFFGTVAQEPCRCNFSSSRSMGELAPISTGQSA